MGVLDSSFNVGDLRATLAKWTDPQDPGNQVPYTPANSPNFINRLNQVCERVDKTGLWKGVCQEVWFNGAPNGYITLPRRCLTVMGGDVGNCAQEVFTAYNEYKLMGLGFQQPNAYNKPGWTDMQDGWPTFNDISWSAPSTIQIQITNVADAGKNVWLDGLDQNGNRIFDQSGDSATGSQGITLVTAFPSVTTTQVFGELNAVSADVMKYPWSIWQVVNGVPSLLSSYEPGETKPKYRRYKTGVIPVGTTIRVYARRRTINLVAETDPVLPGCYAAIEFGLQARNLEDGFNDDGALKKWQMAETELDLQIKAARGRQTISFPWKSPMPASMPSWVR